MKVKTIVPTLYQGVVCLLGVALFSYFYVLGKQQSDVWLWMRSDLICISGILLYPILVFSAKYFDPFKIYQHISLGSLVILAFLGFAFLQSQNYIEMYYATNPSNLPHAYSFFSDRPLPIPARYQNDVAIITEILRVERTSAQDGDLLTLESLYAPGADVVYHHSLMDKDGDLVYKGWENIQENYYLAFVETVPDNPSFEFKELRIFILENKAIAVYKGIESGGQYFPGFVMCTLNKLDFDWRITHLEFGNK
jgi:hypothetical protein